jgi:hypothetical protein
MADGPVMRQYEEYRQARAETNQSSLRAKTIEEAVLTDALLPHNPPLIFSHTHSVTCHNTRSESKLKLPKKQTEN